MTAKDRPQKREANTARTGPSLSSEQPVGHDPY